MNKKRIMAILAACVFSAVSVNPTAVMADSDTEPVSYTHLFYCLFKILISASVPSP